MTPTITLPFQWRWRLMKDHKMTTRCHDLFVDMLCKVCMMYDNMGLILLKFTVLPHPPWMCGNVRSNAPFSGWYQSLHNYTVSLLDDLFAILSSEHNLFVIWWLYFIFLLFIVGTHIVATTNRPSPMAQGSLSAQTAWFSPTPMSLPTRWWETSLWRSNYTMAGCWMAEWWPLIPYRI